MHGVKPFFFDQLQEVIRAVHEVIPMAPCDGAIYLPNRHVIRVNESVGLQVEVVYLATPGIHGVSAEKRNQHNGTTNKDLLRFHLN